MKTRDAKNNDKVVYLQVLYTEQDTNFQDEVWIFCGNRELLMKVLEAHKNVLKRISPVTEGQLSTKGKELLKEVDLEQTVVMCEDIKEYIL